jgi:hypothetical protein
MAERSKKVVDRVREVAVEDLQQARDVATEAFKSRAYLFPIQGMYVLYVLSTCLTECRILLLHLA